MLRIVKGEQYNQSLKLMQDAEITVPALENGKVVSKLLTTAEDAEKEIGFINQGKVKTDKDAASSAVVTSCISLRY
ncbi:hypothetical protein CASFOL_007568 [Castilleja foliolosa]|uniref:Uncharacterized protein n=1 Tax=Castilleja foliolosa TaxID=1961234 RepID=A0ABD3E9M1_9LAMI